MEERIESTLKADLCCATHLGVRVDSEAARHKRFQFRLRAEDPLDNKTIRLTALASCAG